MNVTPMSAEAVLDREFLEIRAKLLELAASFDRLERGEGDVDGDERMALIRRALDVLGSPGEDRAERLQLIFSREYDEGWRREFGIPNVE